MSELTREEEREGEEPGETADETAADRARAARERLEGVDEGTIHGPTRAEAVLALLWAAVLAPAVGAAVSVVAERALGPKTLARISTTFAGHSAWPLTFYGTGFALTFLVLLLPKVAPRRVEEARVFVFERARAYGPHVVLVVLLLDLGGCQVLLGH